MSTPPINPTRSAAVFASAERLRSNALAQAQTACELCIVLSMERVTELSEPTDAHDIGRLRASMREYAKIWRDPSEALATAARTGHLDFPLRFGEGRARPSLRSACSVVLGEINVARAALPSQLEYIALASHIAAPIDDASHSAMRKPRPAGL